MTEPTRAPSAVGPLDGPVVAPETRQAIERWFVSQGMPNFIRGYTAARNVWTRALPALIAWYALGIFAATRAESSPEEDAIAVGVAVLVLVGALVGLNVYRGRPPLSRPDRVGWLEIAGFLLVPAAIALVVQQDAALAVVVAVWNAIVLAVIYVVTQVGIIGITRWAVARAFARMHEVSLLIGRALALLVVLIGFAFLDSSIWQIADRAEPTTMALILLMFGAVAVLFISSLLPGELERLQRTLPTEETLGLAMESPAAPLAEDPRVAASIDAREEPHRFARREILNLSVVVIANEAIGGLLVAIIVAIALVTLGAVAVPADVAAGWAGHPLSLLYSGSGSVSSESIKVAIILGGFSGLAFVLSALSDVVYRKDFQEVSMGSARRAAAVREVYLTGLDIDGAAREPVPAA